MLAFTGCRELLGGVGDHPQPRKRTVSADMLAHVHAIHARHADIEQDQVGAVGGQVQERTFATVHGLDLPAELLEHDLRHPAIDGIIIDDQDALCRGHTPFFLRLARARAFTSVGRDFLGRIGRDRAEHES
jgi:hypothetical protein